MKPSWDEAPEWAQWLAQDVLGGWYWFEGRPDSSDHYQNLEPRP